MATYEMRLAPDPSSPTGFSLQYVYVPSTPVERAQVQIGEIARGLGRQLGLTGRYIAEGTAGTVGIVTNPLAAMGAAATGDMRNFVPLQEQVSRGLTALGVPEPRGAVEESVAGLSRAVAGAGGVAGAARAAIPLATGAVGRGTLTELAAMPGRQLAAGATGEGARQLAEAGGAGPIGQTLAAVGGGAIPFAGAPTTATSLVDDLSAAYRPGSVVRSGAGPVPPPRLQRAEAQGFDTGQPLYRVAVNDINPEAGPNRAAFFSPDPEYANQFPRGRGEEYPEGARGFAVYASRNVADFTNPDHVARVQAALAGNEAGLEHFNRRLAGASDTATGQPEWMISADPAIRDAVERAGFDGMRLDDFGSPSVAMFRDDAVRPTTDDFALPSAPEPLGPVRPRRPSPFDYRAVEAANPQPRPFEIAEPLPAPATYDEAIQQVADLRAQLADADRNVRLSTSIQNPARAGLRSLDQRAVLERQLAAAEGHLARLRPAAPERQNAPGTSEAARAYLERLGMGRVADLGSTRPGEPQARRSGQRPAGDINAQTEALTNAVNDRALGILRGLRSEGFAFETEPGPIVYGGTPGTPSFTVTREYTPTDTPRIFWHGSAQTFKDFADRPTWFAEDPEFAAQFGDVKPYMLRLRNEYKPTPEESLILAQDPAISRDPNARQRLLDRVSREGYDHVNHGFYSPADQTSFREIIVLNPSRENVLPAETLLKSPEFRTGQRMAPDDPRRRTTRTPDRLGTKKPAG